MQAFYLCIGSVITDNPLVQVNHERTLQMIVALIIRFVDFVPINVMTFSSMGGYYAKNQKKIFDIKLLIWL